MYYFSIQVFAGSLQLQSWVVIDHLSVVCRTGTVWGDDVCQRVAGHWLLVVVVLLLYFIHQGDDAVQTLRHTGPDPVLEEPKQTLTDRLHRRNLTRKYEFMG